MTTMDLEKLKMMGAGRAMAVLTSGGDAQGDLNEPRHSRAVCGSCACVKKSFRSLQRARVFFLCARACAEADFALVRVI